MKVVNDTHHTASFSSVGENVLVDQPGSPEAEGTYWMGGEFIIFGG